VIILDHSIVGQSLTSLRIRKDRQFAGCRICGAMFQSSLVHSEPYTAELSHRVSEETSDWRARHNRSHTTEEHVSFVSTGRTFSPEAAHKLVPFGLVPIMDWDDPEVAHAMITAPRAPYDDAEGSIKGLITIP
jgi:hypothetical protein